MPDLQQIGRLLVVIGIVCVFAGALMLFASRIPWLGRLPGDIVVQRKNFTFYFPLATSIIVSILLTLLFWMIGRH